jgi:chemotaxis regulatin CheY-phosphate phosphatase CheZ
MRDFISEVIARTRDEQAKLAETLTAGSNVNSFDDYQRLVGRFEGFKEVLDIINEILREDEDDL